MRLFLRYLIIIFLAIFSLSFTLDLIYTSIYKKSSPRNKVQNLLKVSDKHYDIAFYGSSRVERHIDCELITKITGKSCINFGFSGASLGDILILSKIHKRNNISFDKVFVQLDYNYNAIGLTPYFEANLAPHMTDSIVANELSKQKEYFFYRWVPFYRYLKNEKVLGFRELMSSFNTTNSNRNIKIGFSPKFGTGDKVAGRFPNTLNSNNIRLEKFEEEFQDIAKFYFTAPYCKRLENRSKINELKNKVSSYKNYAASFDKNSDYYFNCGHLNINGAKAFTLMIINDFDL